MFAPPRPFTVRIRKVGTSDFHFGGSLFSDCIETRNNGVDDASPSIGAAEIPFLGVMSRR